MATHADSLTTACPACGRALRLASHYGFLAGAVRCRSCAGHRRGLRRSGRSKLAGFILCVLIPGIFFGTLILGGLTARPPRAPRRPVPQIAPYPTRRERPRYVPPWRQDRERTRPDPQEI
ncbi:MAG: hypothetical protein JXP34_12705 [Planctomycetes bacterium]|nr:hypothetical protein [Planctomycetota bacterium]